MGTVFAAHDLHRSFGGVKAVQGVSVEINGGEVVALLGDNGAGKSTTLKMLAGVLQPDTGRLTFEGKDVRLRSPRAAKQLGIETVYQDLALSETLDVVQNMFSGRELRRFGFVRRKSMDAASEKLLEELEVRVHRRTVPVRNLSGGQRQGIAIARAVGWGSRVLLLDEPTAALGVSERGHVLDVIKRLRERGLGILLISHSIPDVFDVADRMVVLRRGRVVKEFARSETAQAEVVAAITGALPAEFVDDDESA